MTTYQHTLTKENDGRYVLHVWGGDPRVLHAVDSFAAEPTAAELDAAVARMSAELDECHAGIPHIGDMFLPRGRDVSDVCVAINGAARTLRLHDGSTWGWDEVELA